MQTRYKIRDYFAQWGYIFIFWFMCHFNCHFYDITVTEVIFAVECL